MNQLQTSQQSQSAQLDCPISHSLQESFHITSRVLVAYICQRQQKDLKRVLLLTQLDSDTKISRELIYCK